MELTHGSLFSGIGGFELGAQMNGIPTLWNCELELFQRNLLKQNFPETKQYEDIRELRNPGYVDIISGGFPCQDISIAGKGTPSFCEWIMGFPIMYTVLKPSEMPSIR